MKVVAEVTMTSSTRTCAMPTDLKRLVAMLSRVKDKLARISVDYTDVSIKLVASGELPWLRQLVCSCAIAPASCPSAIHTYAI